MSQNTQFEELSSSFQVKRGINTMKSLKAKDTVKKLKEQTEILKLKLHDQGYELQEIKQELKYTNYELHTLYDLCEVISSKLLNIDEVKELADSLLQVRNLGMVQKRQF